MKLVLPFLALFAVVHCGAAGLSFRKGVVPGEFEFDTGPLHGKLRSGGKATGLSQVIHTASGARLDRSMGLFSHYRVFTRGTRYGTGAWDWPSTAKLTGSGSVEVTWTASAERPFELKAVYSWRDPLTLDLETVVTATQKLPSFEVFLASYFSDAFSNALVLVQQRAGSAAHLVAADREMGDWQIFPRDTAALTVISDGRWKIEPNPISWSVRPPFATPIALRTASALGLCAVLMASKAECIAVATPHQTEPHYSTYFSLFGADVAAAATARARTRLAFVTNRDEQSILRLNETWQRQLANSQTNQ